MSEIFVSYAKEDEAVVARLVHALSAQGWPVFWDRDIDPGKSWRDVLDAQLAAARCVVVVWSRTSVESRWVREEAELAQTRGVLVPVLIDDVTPPLGFQEVQAADLTGWTGAYPASELDGVLRSVSAMTNRPLPDAAFAAAPSARETSRPARIRLRNKIPYDQLHAVDRSEQAEALRGVLDDLAAEAPYSPLVFLLPGRGEENPEELVSYHVRAILSKYGLTAGGGDARDFPWVRWSPPQTGAAAARVQEMCATLADIVGVSDRSPGPDAIRTALEDSVNVNVVGSLIYASTLDRAEAELIDAWLAFWHGVGRGGLARPVVVFLCFLFDEDLASGRRWVDEFLGGRGWESLAGIDVSPLPELNPIKRHPDVSSWSRRVLRSVCRVERRELARTTSQVCDLMPADAFSWEDFYEALDGNDLVLPN